MGRKYRGGFSSYLYPTPSPVYAYYEGYTMASFITVSIENHAKWFKTPAEICSNKSQPSIQDWVFPTS